MAHVAVYAPVSVGACIAMRRLSASIRQWDDETQGALRAFLDDVRRGLMADNAVSVIAVAMLQDMLSNANNAAVDEFWTVLVLGCWSVACKVCYDEAVFAIDVVNAWNGSGGVLQP